MNVIPLEALAIKKMACGNLRLNLTENLNWSEFSIFAEAVIPLIGGYITKRNDGPDLRMWSVIIEGHILSLVFDDYPLMIALESLDSTGDAIIEKVYKILFQLKHGGQAT
jgi:hypothetical protein